MAKRTLVRVVLAVAAAGMLAACGGGDNGGTTTQSGATTGAAGGKLVVGFAQTGSESAWRAANTNSVKSEAEKRGIDLKFVSAEGNAKVQQSAVDTFIAQGVNVIILDPIEASGWEPELKKAKAAGIPVIIADRSIDAPADLYACFIGSDFHEEGKRVGEWLAKKTNGKANIAEIEGTLGSAAAEDRKKGFEEVLAQHPDMKIVVPPQTADFKTADAKNLMQTYLQSAQGKDINVVFAHNDDMALGAIQAIKEAGKVPGKDILVVSVDGEKAMVEEIAKGEANCTVECKPLLGPSLFDAAEKVAKGETVPAKTYSQEDLFDETNAKQAVDSRQY